MLVAFLCLFKHSAQKTTEGRRAADFTRANLLACIAGLRAAVVVTPLGKFAVNRARVIVAGLNFLNITACSAAVGIVAVDTAVACLRATATGETAGIKLPPHAHHAVNGAILRVAFARASEGFACYTTSCRLGGNSPSLALGASTATCAAVVPLGEIRKDAIHRTGLVITEPSFAKEWASVTAVGSVGSDLSVTMLGTSTTRLGATSPLAEFADFAVNWARSVTACLAFVQRWANHTTEIGVSESYACAPLRALATRGAAIRPSSKGIDDAIDGARLFVAMPSVRERRAGNTAIGTLLADGAVTRLGASVA